MFQACMEANASHVNCRHCWLKGWCWGI
jgi:hypothetical protein